MIRTLARRSHVVAGFTALSVVCSVIPGAARQTMKPEHFTGLAVPPGTGGSPVVLDFIVERWSTPVEHERVMNALAETGTKGVLDVLRKLPRVATFAAIGAAGYPINYAWKFTAPDGIEHITLVTERFINFWESYNGSRTLDYPITVIELRLKPGGASGDGQIAVAAKLGMDTFSKAIIIENYDIQPVQLTTVKRLK
jgi:hypothetical protein